MATRLRIEVLLTDADEDIIEFITSNKTPRSAQFKNAMRVYMKNKTEEQFDVRVKRLLSEVISEKGLNNSIQASEVAPKKTLGFMAKKG